MTTIKRPSNLSEVTKELLETLSNTVKGMTEKQAQSWADENGFECRTTSKDGNSYIVLCDYNIHRINIDLINDQVVAVSLG